MGSVSTSSYVKFVIMAMTSMMFGSQFIHNIYKPLDDLEDYVEREMEKLKAVNK